MRTRYIQLPDGKLVNAEDYYSEPASPMVMPDIEPYVSMADGSVINSRSQHRAHLRQHGCIEVGNEKLQATPMPDPPGRKEYLIHQVKQLGHEGFKRAVKRSLDEIRWNSRGR